MLTALIEDMTMGEAEEMTPSRMRELKRSSVATATMESIGFEVFPKDGAPESVVDEAVKTTKEYLSHFALPSLGCPNCGRKASFRWGITNGEGSCGACHYPARARHSIPDVCDIEGIVLFYHPSQLTD